jgi:uncharacterized protein YegL
MSVLEDAPIDYKEEPKCPFVLLLDTSGSMMEAVEGKRKIDVLNGGVKALKESLDDQTKKRLEIAVVTFGGIVKKGEFLSPNKFEPINYEAGGSTPMGEAILSAIDMVAARKQIYKENGIGDYFRPWIWIVTDGYPTDMEVGDEKWNEVVRKVHDGEVGNHFSFWAVGVSEADMEKLKVISANRVPVKLKELKFKEMFEWLANTINSISRSNPGDQLKAEPIDKWATFEV